MYQSMFVLGVLMFGFFAASFNNYSDFAESITLDNNLDRVLEEINSKIIDLLDHTRELKGQTSTITINVKLALDSEYAGEAYIIQTAVNGANISLEAVVKNSVISELPIGVESGSDFAFRQVTFTGSMASSSDDTGMIYTWDGVSETIQFY